MPNIWSKVSSRIKSSAERKRIHDDNISINIDSPEALEEVAVHTHYMPLTWRNRGHTQQVYDEFCSKFKHPIICFLEDVASALMTPYVLWFYIAHY